MMPRLSVGCVAALGLVFVIVGLLTGYIVGVAMR